MSQKDDNIIKEILQICGGFPLSITIAGRALREEIKAQTNGTDAFQVLIETLRENDNLILTCDLEGYDAVSREQLR